MFLKLKPKRKFLFKFARRGLAAFLAFTFLLVNSPLGFASVLTDTLDATANIRVAPPTDVEVVVNGAGSVKVSWTASASEASASVDGYKIYYKQSANGTFTQNATLYLPADERSKTINGLTTEDTYDFLVTTFDVRPVESRLNCSSCRVNDFFLSTSPTNTSMTINDLSPTADVVISLSTYAENATEMYIFGDVDEHHPTYGDQVKRWIPYASSAMIALTNYNGVKDIDIKYRNTLNAESAVITRQITLQLPFQNEGGGGGGSSSSSTSNTESDSPPTTEVLSSTTSGDTTTLATSTSEVTYSVSNVGNGSDATTLSLNISDLAPASVADPRLIEVGYFDTFGVWKTYSDVDVVGNFAFLTAPENEIQTTLLARVVDAVILDPSFAGENYNATKPVLLPSGGTQNLNYSITLTGANVTVEIPAGTEIRTESGAIYEGILYSPTLLDSVPPFDNLEIDFENAILIGSTATGLTFDQPVLMTFSVPNSITLPKLVYYDTTQGEYLLVRDVLDNSLGGTLSPDGTTISAWVNHMTIYTVVGVNDRNTLALLEAKTQNHYAGGGFGVGEFSDLLPDHWAYEPVMELWNRFIVAGYPDHTFRPDQPVNRAELTKIALLAFRASEINTLRAVDNFPDVAPSAWFSDFIAKAKTLQIISGYEDGFFRPGNPINRAEALKILTLAAGVEFTNNSGASGFTDIGGEEWYAPFARAASHAGIVRGYPIPKKQVLVFTQNLGFGASGAEVLKLQHALQTLNFYHSEPNGKFDADTQHALYRYQVWKGMIQSWADESAGYLGDYTRKLLNRAEITLLNNSDETLYEFRPQNPITRAEVSALTYQLLKFKYGEQFKTAASNSKASSKNIIGRINNPDEIFDQLSVLRRKTRNVGVIGEIKTSDDVFIALKVILG